MGTFTLRSKIPHKKYLATISPKILRSWQFDDNVWNGDVHVLFKSAFRNLLEPKKPIPLQQTNSDERVHQRYLVEWERPPNMLTNLATERVARTFTKFQGLTNCTDRTSSVSTPLPSLLLFLAHINFICQQKRSTQKKGASRPWITDSLRDQAWRRPVVAALRRLLQLKGPCENLRSPSM